MPLYDRLIGRDESLAGVGGTKISVHMFESLMDEFSRGRMTGPQCQQAITDHSGTPLDAAGVTEVQALLATLTGTATQKLVRSKEINDVLMLGEHNTVGYQRPSEVKTRLGV